MQMASKNMIITDLLIEHNIECIILKHAEWDKNTNHMSDMNDIGEDIDIDTQEEF